MRISVLGCNGAELLLTDTSGRKTCYNTSGFLIDGTVMLDAGTITAALPLEELVRIRQVLISHVHFDHIKGLPFLADTVFGQIDSAIRIRGLEEILGALKDHLLNDILWPDFTRLPEGGSPTFELEPLKEGTENTVGHLRVTPIRVNHVIPATGFIIEDDEGAMLYSGDTFETGLLWEEAAKRPNLKAAMIEASFPDSMAGLAEQSGHLTPRLLGREFGKIGRPGLPLYVYHMKPQFRDEISEDIKKLGLENVRCLKDGETITV